MKKDIHPQYYPKAKVDCACGNTFTVGATKSEFSIEICSNCHPFYSGKEKMIDSAGRVDRFKKRIAKKDLIKAPAKKTEKISKKLAEDKIVKSVRITKK
ncbi:MAG: 50S ribosomal protein L31 [Candidatus Portnoybacteria bacterium CG10_big_fil_rev_8_21_14_0_10_36_7]|uniref:Large ribosomal subunit protein bL31 n=1 Tax=Candidatus Portnoybacteria bacterium CG10_big_fil_rev_8_21_14_0_10_36_7 TaxID=1974812 RepID=A0A2M8KDQ2_9BACT|nr:MAG: 50S ribosomal protein L31 [Candidatus Portnoybacteria bacterium CG10_big_fil_rev_8_21_14_0_10_36_7]